MNKHILYKMIAQKKVRIIIIISTWHITSQKDPFYIWSDFSNCGFPYRIQLHMLNHQTKFLQIIDNDTWILLQYTCCLPKRKPIGNNIYVCVFCVVFTTCNICIAQHTINSWLLIFNVSKFFCHYFSSSSSSWLQDSVPMIPILPPRLFMKAKNPNNGIQWL